MFRAHGVRGRRGASRCGPAALQFVTFLPISPRSKNSLYICPLLATVADFLFSASQKTLEAIVATKNLFRVRALCISALAICFTCGIAFSAAPRPIASAENLQGNPKAIDVDSATLDSYQGLYATDANPDSP